jgi:cell division protein FtsB
MKQKNNLLKIIAKFIKYNRKLIVILSLFVVLIYLAVFGNKGIIQRVKLEKEKKQLEHQLIEEVKRTDELQKEIENLHNSDETIEKVAREKYGMTKDGEKIYKIIIDTVKEESR